MTDKPTGPVAAAAEIIDYLQASAETIEAIILKHCPEEYPLYSIKQDEAGVTHIERVKTVEDKAVGKLVEAARESLTWIKDVSGHVAGLSPDVHSRRLVNKLEAALADYEKANK